MGRGALSRMKILATNHTNFHESFLRDLRVSA